jgi:hypothetical protein
VRIARELVATIRQLNRAIAEVDEELAQRTADLAPPLLEGSFRKAELSSQTTNLTLSRRESSINGSIPTARATKSKSS